MSACTQPGPTIVAKLLQRPSSNEQYGHDVSRRIMTDFVNAYCTSALTDSFLYCPLALLLFARFYASLEPTLKDADEIIEPLNDEIRVLVLRKVLVDVVD